MKSQSTPIRQPLYIRLRPGCAQLQIRATRYPLRASPRRKLAKHSMPGKASGRFREALRAFTSRSRASKRQPTASGQDAVLVRAVRVGVGLRLLVGPEAFAQRVRVYVCVCDCCSWLRPRIRTTTYIYIYIYIYARLSGSLVRNFFASSAFLSSRSFS